MTINRILGYKGLLQKEEQLLRKKNIIDKIEIFETLKFWISLIFT